MKKILISLAVVIMSACVQAKNTEVIQSIACRVSANEVRVFHITKKDSFSHTLKFMYIQKDGIEYLYPSKACELLPSEYKLQ